MIFLVKLLILTLPFVDLQVSGIRPFDPIFLLVIGVDLYDKMSLKRSLQIDRDVLKIAAIFVGFSVYGFININYLASLHIVGSWDTGFQSERLYAIVACARTLLYLFGCYIATKCLLRHHSVLMPFIYNYFIGYMATSIVLFFIPVTRPLMSSVDGSNNWLKSTFTEDGPASQYIVFIYGLLMTYRAAFNRDFLSRNQNIVLQVLTFVFLGLTHSTRGITLYLVFLFLLYFANAGAKNIGYMLRVLAVLAIVTPLTLASVWDTLGLKLVMYFTTSDTSVNAAHSLGRYAGLIMLPRIVGQYPWFGIGYGNYIFYRGSLEFGTGLPNIGVDYAENSYVQDLMEIGIVGSMLLLYFLLYKPLRRIIGNRSYGLLPYSLAYALYIATIIPDFYQFWLWFFLTYVMIRSSEKSVEPVPAK